MEMYAFIRDCKSKHLTLEDILKWKVGDEVDVVIWDRNFEEHWIWDQPHEKLFDPVEFFRHSRCKLKYKGDMIWDITFDFGGTIEHPAHLDTGHLPTNWTWVGLDREDGKIHITNEILAIGEKIPEDRKAIHMHWSEFPKSTRVGWRGPMMLWKDLKAINTQVYHDDLEKVADKSK